MRQVRGRLPTLRTPGLSAARAPPIMPALGNKMHQTVRAACLWLPEAEEFVSHGSPNFRVRGKTFATFVVNHHGDQRVALWLPAAPGAQEHHLRMDPENFFVPPYVGPRGWVGVRLDRGLDWRRITGLVREAYERVAPPALSAGIGKAPVIKAPKALSGADVDPLKSARGRRMLEMMRKICLPLPETREAAHFGHPVWQAGTRSFAMVRHDGERLTVCFWVGADRQNLLTADERFRIPPYFGHNGWIALDVSRHADRREIEALARQSYRHFALKRMIKEMPPDRAGAL
jgi:predicted DNA-binding protein (MmcQ/YjbR family)